MKLHFTILISCWVLQIQLNAQGWQRDYPADSLGYGFCLDTKQTDDGGYIMVGEVDLPTGAIRHYLQLLKTDAEGNLQWRKTYANYWEVRNDEGVAVYPTNDGGYIVGGSRDGNFLVMNTDGNGDTLWTKQHGTPSPDYGRAMSPTSDSGYILAGTTFIPNAQNIFIVKIDENGDSLWNTTVGTGTFGVFMEAFDIQETLDSGYILVGSLNGGLQATRLTQNGAVLWAKTYPVGTGGVGHAVRVTTDGNYIVAGSVDGFAGTAPMLTKINDQGDLIWSKSLPIPFHSRVTDIEIMSNGNYAITGSIYHFWYGNNNIGFMGVTDTTGNLLWYRDLDTTSNARGAAIEQTADGGFIVGGSNTTGYFLLKTDSLGVTPTQPIVLPALTVTLAPNPMNANTIFTIFTIKNVPFSVLTFRLYTATGALIKQQLVAPQFTLNRGTLTAGIYFYELQTPDFSVYRGRLVVVD